MAQASVSILDRETQLGQPCPARSAGSRRQTDSMVKPAGICPAAGPWKAACSVTDVHRMPYFSRLILFLFCLMVLVESRKPKKRRWTGQLGTPKPRYRRGRGGGGHCRGQPHSGQLREGCGSNRPSSWSPFPSRREMNTASHWAQIHYRVTGSERPGWAFHSDVCAPPKHSDLRQVAEDLVGKASLYFSDCPALILGLHPAGTINGLLSNYLKNFF